MSSDYEKFKENIEYYNNLVIPECPACGSRRTAIVSCGITGASLYIASQTPKLHLRSNGKPSKYYCKECKTYFDSADPC